MAYSTIIKPSDYFNTKTYTQSGSNNNGNTQTLTMDNVGWVWIKNRDYTNGHCLFDIVRGGDKLLASNGTAVQETIGGGLTFGSSDTTIGADTGGYGFNNRVGDDYVAWHWRTSGSQGSSNTDGTINTTYTSANTTSGFSISTVTLSGSGNQTFGHGLGVTPSLVIFKCTSHAESWKVYNSSLSSPESKYLQLDLSDAAGNASNIWGAGMTSSTVGVNVGVLGTAGQDYVAYVFAPIKGFSKFGVYDGNGSADGSFIYTGFKPGWIMLKQSSHAGNDWWMFDSKRLGYNPDNYLLRANISNAELTNDDIDLVSGGFKIRSTDGGINTSGNQYFYMAFAESPLVANVDGGLPTTAR